MNIEERKEKVPELKDKQINDMFRAIIMGKDITEIIETSKGKFKVKFPRAKDLESISRLCAYRLNGIPAQCFDVVTYDMMQQIATLDVVVLEGPEWYELAKKKNPNFGWSEMPSKSFISEVYALAYDFRVKVQKEIESDSGETDNGMVADEHNNNVSEPGLFDEMSGQS